MATRLADNDLYYHVYDPTGTSLVMVDADDGEEVGRMLYDGFGGVLTSTLPLTLTGALPDMPDAATGLVHLGGGRWYDPALGRPLQPNPAGGPPTVPQALNRYTATAVGQPGVYQAATSTGMLSCCNLFDIAVDLAAVSTGDMVGLEAHLTSRIARVKATGSGRPNFARKLNRGGGVRVRTDLEDISYSPASPHSSANLNETRISDLQRHLNDGTLTLSEASRWNKVMNHEITPISGRLGLSIEKFKVGEAIDGGAIGFVFDAGWQVAQDWDNPYLTDGAKLGRGIVAGGVGFVAGGLVVLTVGTGGTGIVVAVVVGWIAEGPINNFIFQSRGWIPSRDLAPLQ